MVRVTDGRAGRAWRDTFEGPAGQPPDPDVWTPELGAGGWGCDQLQEYTASTANAALTGDGRLALTARREADGRITSARLVTRGRLVAGHGRVEARIRVPSEAGTWPAFWMLGKDVGEAGWPACGEIDVMEHVAVDPARVHGTLHGPGCSGLDGGLTEAHDLGRPLADDFHRFAVDWSSHEVRWLVDDVAYHRLTPADVPGPWPFDQPFSLLLNLAVGGAWPSTAAVAPVLPATMLVAEVAVSSAARPAPREPLVSG